MQIYEAIKRYLKETGIKQSFIAEKVGINDYKLSRILHGQSKITMTDYCKICKVLGVSLDYFIEK